jgi:type IV pilus assembly protein PilY1
MKNQTDRTLLGRVCATTTLRSRSLARIHTVGLASLLVLASHVSVLAQTAPAQEPLVSRDGGGVKPNMMLTMDDSGSMLFQHMPENQAVIGSFTVNNPVGSYSIKFDPDDNGAQANLVGFFGPGNPANIGTIAGQAGNSNWRQKFMRSADTNTIYYNPEVRYLPWANADGTRYAAASVTAAKVDPSPTVGGTVNLTNVRNVDTTWCYRDARTDCSSNTESYNPGLYYRLNRSGAGQYLDPQTAGNYTEFNINANAATTYTKYPDRTDCSGTSCTRTEERQNFANWFVYYRSRVLLAKASVGEALSATDDKFRFGYGRINKTNRSSIDGYNTRTIESGVRDFTATRKNQMLTWLYAMPIGGGTPLRRAMQDIGEYYSSSVDTGPWSDVPGTSTSLANQKTCRRSYHMLVTDGYWNDSIGTDGLAAVGNVDNTDGSIITGPGGRSYQYLRSRPYLDGSSNLLADYAMYYWNRDLRTDLTNKVVPSAADPSFWQSMVNFNIGLGVRGLLDPATDLPALTAGTKSWGTNQIDDLWHAAVNSRGEYFSAKDPAELTQAIRSAVGKAANRELREAGVAAAAVVLEADNRKYIPKYQTAAWVGDVDAYALDANGQAGVKVWSAEAKLPAWNTRKIYTWDAGRTTPAGVTFTWGDMSAANRTALGVSSGTLTLVDFLRGDRANESSSGYRVRDGLLGDFVNANPVFAKDAVAEGYESLPTIGSSYPAFLAQKKARSGVLYIGGNGGMLHGFIDTKGVTPANDGKEVFAYVPRAVYPSLSTLVSQTYGTPLNYHKYFVDGPLREFDAHVKAPGASTASWRNYLVGTLGAGGKGVYALDVTDPTSLGASTIRWELTSTTDSDLGYITAPVTVGVLPNGKWVAIFGNGYSESATSRAYLFVVDLETGSSQKVAVDSTVLGNGLGGVTLQKNAAGQIVSAYAGDLKGKMWKFDYDSAQTSGFSVANAGAAIFAAVGPLGNAQPILQAPVLFEHSEGGPLLAFGTGRLLTTADVTDTSIQSVYAIWLKPSDSMGPPYARSQLVSRALTSTTAPDGSVYFDVAGTDVNYTTRRGWYIDLSITGFDGLRTLYAPQRVGQTLVLFSAAAPAQTIVPCDTAVGQGVNLLFPAEKGKSANYCLFDTNGDGEFDSNDICNIAGYATPADGMDAILRSTTTTCDSSYCRTKYSIQNTTGGLKIQEQIEVPPPPPGGGTTKDRIWRRIINPPIR